MASIAVIVRRPVLIEGGHCPSGTRLRVPALVAAALLDCRKAELANTADADAVEAARVADRHAALREASRGPR
jgi:hypothetical protein